LRRDSTWGALGSAPRALDCGFMIHNFGQHFYFLLFISFLFISIYAYFSHVSRHTAGSCALLAPSQLRPFESHGPAVRWPGSLIGRGPGSLVPWPRLPLTRYESYILCYDTKTRYTIRCVPARLVGDRGVNHFFPLIPNLIEHVVLHAKSRVTPC
jgi:hypothetical protein